MNLLTEHYERVKELAALDHLPTSFQSPDEDRILSSHTQIAQFAFAAMLHLMPELSDHDCNEMIRKVFYYQQRAIFDEGKLYLKEITDVEDPHNVLKHAEKEPYIFCTFHFGSYRYIHNVLFDRGINYAMLLTRDILAKDGERFLAQINAAGKASGKDVTMTLLDSESPSSIRECLRQIRRGSSLLAYVDGNAGVGGMIRRDDESMVRISILQGQMYVRRGLAVLGRLTGAPIVTVVSEYLDNGRQRLTAYEPIRAARQGDDAEVMSQIYGALERHMRKDPSQWEGWLYAYKFLALSSDAPASSRAGTVSEASDAAADRLTFNHRRFALLRYADGIYLLDKQTIRIRSTKKGFGALLDRLARLGQIDVSALGEDERLHIGALREGQILIGV